jgi:GNAT superfamily N-acetyltransferase
MSSQGEFIDSSIEQVSLVKKDKITKEICSRFDIKFKGETRFKLESIPEFDKNFNIGLVIGPSGSGKSTIIHNRFSVIDSPQWRKDRSIVSHFASVEDAIERLTAVGLNSIPAWLRPFRVLSEGEKFRANMARLLNSDIAIDEFTSVVDRSVAKSVSVSINKYVYKHNVQNLVFASCHYDIIEWLRPCWVYDLNGNTLYSGRWLQRPEINLSIYEGDHSAWEMFKKHHYLSSDIMKSSKIFLCFWDDILLGIVATCPLPSGTVKKAWREHRLVVLPDYQGLGIGMRLSDAVAEMYIDNGKRYFAKTSHFKIGNYRNKVECWRPTSSNEKNTSSKHGTLKGWKTSDGRMCFSHEYVKESK